MNSLSLIAITVSIFLLSACGGSDSSDPMNNKNYIVILQDVEAGICENDIFISNLSTLGFQGVLTRETDSTTTCAIYGKVNDGVACSIEVLGNGIKNCVVGFDDIPSDVNILARQVSPISLDDTVELLTASFE